MRRSLGLGRGAVLAAALVGLALAGAACGSSSGSTGSGGHGTVQSEHSSKLGSYLADSKGFTLYWDSKGSTSKIACTGSCTGYWPPLTVSSGTKPTGVSGLGTVKRPGGQTQVTWKGHPLYRFSGDSAAGQTHGEGLTDRWGSWYAGGTTPSQSGTTSTTSGGYGGY